MRTTTVPTRRPFPSTRLHVEELEVRPVPAMLDLTTVGATASIDSVGFLQSNPQPTGVGVIHDFLRIQANKGSVEQGYNTNARPVQFDSKKEAPHNRAIRLSELPTTT